MIEYSGANEEPIKPELGRKAELEARREVALLAFAGHLAPRAVIDDWNEIAYTCDVCCLWGYTWKPDQKSRHDVGRVDERGGAVFTEKCSVNAITKKFGFFNIEFALATNENVYVQPNEYEKGRKAYSEKRERDLIVARVWQATYRERVKNDPELYAKYLATRKRYRERKREERRAATATKS